MDACSSKGNSVLSSPYSSPNVGALLKLKIISWTQETGVPVSVAVHIDNRTFHLHRYPILSKSGFFQRKLSESNDLIELPNGFPGGSETFEMIALFIYGSSTLVDPFNVAALRCAAHILEMTEDYCTGNLCERFDIYLNQVVLQSWDDTLIVLQKCQTLTPLAEDLLIVSRCIESLAFMACMEILDPDRKRDQPVINLESLTGQPWSSELVKQIVNQDLWVKDLIALPFKFFSRVIGSLRRQGMKEKYVSPIVLFYANKWILSPTRTRTRTPTRHIEDDLIVLQCVLDLLPAGNKASKVIPVGFYFSLLAKSLDLGLKSDHNLKLQDQIASVLHMAHVEDFLFPGNGSDPDPDPGGSGDELSIMEDIFSRYVSVYMNPGRILCPKSFVVAELWDIYLTRIVMDRNIDPKRFMDLILTVPVSSRQSHDYLYRALNTFLQVHPELSQEEKAAICKYLNCQKLSQEVCIDAVQNELMPLRLIVQALFVQQLSTHQAFKECSDSFRYGHLGEYSESLSSSRFPNSKSQNLTDTSPGESGSRPLGFLLKKDIARQDYESTSFRIQNLEQELMNLKRNLHLQNVAKKREMDSGLRPFGLEGRKLSRKRNPIGQVTNCMGSVNFATQRKYASRILKVFRRISLFGRGKLKRKQGAKSNA